MYNSFCYGAFKVGGVFPFQIDALPWIEFSMLAKYSKIEQEENIIQMVEIKEGNNSNNDGSNINRLIKKKNLVDD